MTIRGKQIFARAIEIQKEKKRGGGGGGNHAFFLEIMKQQLFKKTEKCKEMYGVFFFSN